MVSLGFTINLQGKGTKDREYLGKFSGHEITLELEHFIKRRVIIYKLHQL
jgi:hypothetical protein